MPNDANLSDPSGGPLLCPSVQCSTNARLIGIVGQDDKIGYVRPALPVSQAFVDAAEQTGRPTARFRFAAPCIRSGCRNWRDKSCQVIESQVQEAGQGESAVAEVPSCAIRASCVWFAQRRLAACRVCPHVITDIYLRVDPDDTRQQEDPPTV